MNLTIEQIKDYQYCPMMYVYNHLQKAKPTKTSTIDKFAIHSLKQAFYWFFYSQQDGKTPTLRAFRDKFGSLYIYDRTYTETMFIDAKSRARSLEKRCVVALNNFYNRYKNDTGVPLLINKEYTLDFNGVIVGGTIPVIRETQYKDVELISFTNDISVASRSERNFKIEVQRDIDIIASSMAFKKTYGWEVDNHYAHSMYFDDVHVCDVDGPLTLNLEKIVYNVAEAIDKEIFYPIYNSRCSTCAYRQTCLKEW